MCCWLFLGVQRLGSKGEGNAEEENGCTLSLPCVGVRTSSMTQDEARKERTRRGVGDIVVGDRCASHGAFGACVGCISLMFVTWERGTGTGMM